jgi:uncharacterized protein (DUF1330 family)
MPHDRRAIDPTREGFKEMFSRVPPDVPVLMVNLVRFWKTARDHSGIEFARTGRQAYATYLELFKPLLAAAGGRIAWSGVGHFTLIAPPDEIWDEVLIVEYPRLRAFGDLIRSEEYKKVLPHRLAAISDTRLIVTTLSATGPDAVVRE